MLGLGTLLKHEMKAVGRRVLPCCAALLVVSIIFGITIFGFGPSGPVSDFLSGLFGVLYCIMAVGVVVYTAIVLIQRYYSNLLGNEGYLNFTLPVTVNAHIASKTISAGIWAALSILIAGLSVLILLLFAVTPAELLEEAGVVLSELNTYVGGFKVLLAVLECLVLIVMALGEAALKVYAAISVGHLWEKHRALGAVGAYVGFVIIECVLAGLMDHFIPMYRLFSLYISDFAVFQIELLITFFVVAVTSAIYWFISYRILDRHLNLQ